jgi:hypothetical protein
MTQIRLLEVAVAPVELAVIGRPPARLVLRVKGNVVEEIVLVLDSVRLRVVAESILLAEAANKLIDVDDCPAVEEPASAD